MRLGVVYRDNDDKKNGFLQKALELVNRLQRLLLRPFNRFQIPLQKEILRIEIGLTILGGD